MTTWELARDIWYFITKPGSNVVILCQSDANNSLLKELSSRTVTMLEGLKKEYPEVPVKKISDTKWVLINENGEVNGQLLIGGAGATEKAASKKFRGFRINRLHVTEVAFFEFAIETLTGILNAIPSVEHGSEITFESTPKGAAGPFYDGYMAAKDGKSEYKAHFFRWFEQLEYSKKLNPGEVLIPETEREKQLVQLYGVTQEQLKWYRQKVNDPALGQAKVDQEFPSDEETCWLFDGRLFFDREVLAKLRTNSAASMSAAEIVHAYEGRFARVIGGLLAGLVKVWHLPEHGKQYILAIDPSSGIEQNEEEAKKKKLDPSAIVILERETGKYCASLCAYLAPEVVATYAATLGAMYNWALVAVERSSSWQAIIDALALWKRPKVRGQEQGNGYPHIYYDEDKVPGFFMSKSARPAVLDALEIAIRTGTFQPPDIDLIKEMQLFVVIEDKPEAASGAHDDRILATAIALKLSQVSLGLHHSKFASAPSVAFVNTPISFEGIPTGASQLMRTEIQRWAQGPVQQDSGWSLVHPTASDMDGF